MAQNRLQKLIRPGCPRWVDCVAKLFVTAAYIYPLLRLPWLAPDIITAVVNGRQPPQLNARLRRGSCLFVTEQRLGSSLVLNVLSLLSVTLRQHPQAL